MSGLPYTLSFHQRVKPRDQVKSINKASAEHQESICKAVSSTRIRLIFPSRPRYAALTLKTAVLPYSLEYSGTTARPMSILHRVFMFCSTCTERFQSILIMKSLNFTAVNSLRRIWLAKIREEAYIFCMYMIGKQLSLNKVYRTLGSRRIRRNVRRKVAALFQLCTVKHIVGGPCAPVHANLVK